MTTLRHTITASEPRERGREIRVRGAVQGVGYRPFVYALAVARGLNGWVRNNGEGVVIQVAGTEQSIDSLIHALTAEAPSAARIAGMTVREISPPTERGFRILQSETSDAATAAITPDLATCPECVRELFLSTDRRFQYPFLNCTQCGPRFSIIERIPYDRPNTSMRGFAMCARCQREYDQPDDRRFHAQPNACPDCGPHLTLWDERGQVLNLREDAWKEAAAWIRRGRIVAVKGIGGFHLLVDARNDEAVRRLRQRKQREEKPLAVMFPDIDAIANCAQVSPLERDTLCSAAAPIVLLVKAPSGSCALAASIAPGQSCIGALLPYTPLYHLLMRELNFPVVATSGNLSDEPICIHEQDALSRLNGIADGFLVNDRPIVRPVDDSVVRVAAGGVMVLRRSRGYAPYPLNLDGPLDEPVLAVGGHMKNVVGMAFGHTAYLSQHVGDLDTEPATHAFEDAVGMLQSLYDRRPARVVCDAHPDYRSTHWARASEWPVVTTQHHHAHIVSCMVEHQLRGKVCGIAWDGTGYGTDGAIWGGEWLWASRTEYRRAAHFRYFRLPGGEQAIREPRRCALGLLYACYGAELFQWPDMPTLMAFMPSELNVLRPMLERGVQSPWTSSAGRLFDAVASLIGLRQRTRYEGQAAMELEAAANAAAHDARAYEWAYTSEQLDWAPMVRQIVEDVRAGIPQEIIARAFHRALIEGMVTMAQAIGESRVVLSGGCFQNVLLLEGAIQALKAAGLEPYWHREIPPNDGGLALGQLGICGGE